MNTVQMTEGSIWKPIIYFSIPMLLSNVFQQLYNSVDSIIVGRYVGSDALAAVGSSSSIINLLVGFFMGLSLGSGVIISQSYGANDKDSVEKAVHTSISMTVIAGILLTVVGVYFTPLILKLMGTPDSVFKESVVYLRIYFYGIITVMLYNVGGAILRAVGDSKTPLYVLIFSSILNIILDIIFVKYLSWGISGAAWATIISQGLSAVLVLIILAKSDKIYKLSIKKLTLYKKSLEKIVSIGLPSAFQNAAISLSNVIIQGSINSFGALAMAGCSSYQKVEGFALMPIMSFSMAISTFVGQNVGANRYDRVLKGTKYTMIMSIISIISISIVMYIFSPSIISIFSSDPEVIEFGVKMQRTIVPFYFLLTITHIISGMLRGIGKTLIPSLSMIFGWCLLRMIWITVALNINHNIKLVFIAYPITWSVSTIILIIYLIKSDIIKDMQMKGGLQNV